MSVRGALVHVLLDRPRARNAIEDRIIATLDRALDGWAKAPDTYAVAITSSVPGVFSIGSDLPRMQAAARQGAEAIGRLLQSDYNLFWRVECFTKPIAALINGSIAGAALGIALHGTHRVAQENFSLSFPEVSLGMVPQAGVVHRLARLPGHIGMYLALSGRSLGRADALALGFVTHAIDRRHDADILAALSDAQPIDPLLDVLHRDPGPRDLDYFAPAIERCFAADSVEEIIARLNRERGQMQLWAEGVIRDMTRHSPLALKATHRLLRAAAGLDLRANLVLTHQVLSWLLVAPDFAVGVEAALVAHDRNPKWPSGSLQRVRPEEVTQLFEPLEGAVFELSERKAMQRR